MSWWCPPDGIALPTFAELRKQSRRSWTRRRPWNLRYSEDQPRGPDGKFESGGGGSDTSSGTLPAASPQDLQTAVGRWDNNFEDVFKVRSAADQIVTGQAVTKEGFHATEATRAAAETDARALISGVEHGDPSTETLYRGMTIPAEDVGRYQEGQPVAFSLGSFSSDPDIATYATNPRFNNFQGNEGVPVYYELAPGARNVDFEKAAGIARDSEHITGGTFQVTHIEPWQKPDIFPGPNGIKVSLQQMEPPKVGMAIRSRSRRVRLEDLDPYLSGTMPKVRVRAVQRRRLRRDEQRYSEDQPRDSDGRFGSGGGADTASLPAHQGGDLHGAVDRWQGNEHDVIKVQQAADQILQGEKVSGMFAGRHEEDARTLIQGIKDGQPTTETLYRGMSVPNPSYTEGQTVNFSLGSFTEKQDFATTAASPLFNGHVGSPVIYELEPGAHTLNFSDVQVVHDAEHLTGGSFQVTHVEPYVGTAVPSYMGDPNGLRVSLRQTGVVGGA